MKDNLPYPEINAARISVGGNTGGMIFAASTVIVFFLGVPLVRYMFPAAIVAGCGIALILKFVRHATPGAPWIPTAREK
jgi:hypothetical protein